MTGQAAIHIPGLGILPAGTGLTPLQTGAGGRFCVGDEGVVSIHATGDRKVEFIAFREHTLAYVASSLGYPAFYPVHPVRMERPVTAVLMDLDGTSVHSEDFWTWLIERTTADLLGNPRFTLEPADLPYVSGHSVSEHLQYCVSKYCPSRTVEQARRFYFENTRREMQAILAGHGRVDAFRPAPGLKDFLLSAKSAGMRIALVTSGLYEKAYPEIVAAFRTLSLGDPAEFYDAIITAGQPLGRGAAGTLGELTPKPHPWLYAEAARVGLGIPFDERNRVVGIEDSGAGVCAIRLAGFPTIGLVGGNIESSGTRALCDHYCGDLAEVWEAIA